MDRINFYGERDDFGFLSNFYPSRFVLQDKEWQTVEHYYQAMKSPDLEIQEMIRKCETPKDAKAFGRRIKMREDWESVKDGFMMAALNAKFGQNPFLRILLRETGDAYLSEHTKNDKYWADGGDDTGKNMLGHLLMITRFYRSKELHGGAIV